jgi:hypothetical protein
MRRSSRVAQFGPRGALEARRQLSVDLELADAASIGTYPAAALGCPQDSMISLCGGRDHLRNISHDRDDRFRNSYPPLSPRRDSTILPAATTRPPLPFLSAAGPLSYFILFSHSSWWRQDYAQSISTGSNIRNRERRDRVGINHQRDWDREGLGDAR